MAEACGRPFYLTHQAVLTRVRAPGANCPLCRGSLRHAVYSWHTGAQAVFSTTSVWTRASRFTWLRRPPAGQTSVRTALACEVRVRVLGIERSDCNSMQEASYRARERFRECMPELAGFRRGQSAVVARAGGVPTRRDERIAGEVRRGAAPAVALVGPPTANG